MKFSGKFLLLAVGSIMLATASADAQKTGQFASLTRYEVEMLLADAVTANPEIAKRLASEPDIRKQQLENLTRLLAFASQAEREGFASDPTNLQELMSITAEVIALNYDREVNKNKPPALPFASITAQRTATFWSGTAGAAHEKEFQRFIDAKIKLRREGNPEMAGRVLTDGEKAEARTFFAKIKLLEADYRDKAAKHVLPPGLAEKIELQAKLQAAQFLARLYSQKISDRAKVSDAEVSAFIAAHPELDPSAKKAKAEKILARARAGEDFAALANEFSDDPGNLGEQGNRNGGLYSNVPVGRMIPAFERAALALETGGVAPGLVETDYGYHIIKLEKKSSGSPSTSMVYDVRHVLISTTLPDVPDPSGRPVPLREYVRGKLASDKEKQIISKIIADNNITVPADFTVPPTAAPAHAVAAPKPTPVRKPRPAAKRRTRK